jgi:phosphoglycerol transferase MdoB-like AlkP superfamily enzyme
MKTVSHAAVAIAAVTTLVFADALKPTSLEAAMFISAWLLLLYAGLALIVAFFAKAPVPAKSWAVITLVVAAGGVLFLANIIYWHPDPQGGIAVFFTPVYQAIGVGVLVPICRWLIR